MFKNNVRVFICQREHVVHIPKRGTNNYVVPLVNEIANVVSKISCSLRNCLHVSRFNTSFTFRVLPTFVVCISPTGVADWAYVYERSLCIGTIVSTAASEYKAQPDTDR